MARLDGFLWLRTNLRVRVGCTRLFGPVQSAADLGRSRGEGKIKNPRRKKTVEAR